MCNLLRRDKEINTRLAFDMAKQTAFLKADILAFDPYESGMGRILQVGHLHAHALERYFEFSIPHASAVFWGLAVDAHLFGTVHPTTTELAADMLVPLAKSASILDGESWASSIDVDQLLAAYFRDTKYFHYNQSGYRLLRIKNVGEYAEFENRALDIQIFEEEKIRDSIEYVARKLLT